MRGTRFEIITHIEAAMFKNLFCLSDIKIRDRPLFKKINIVEYTSQVGLPYCAKTN
jgi:hypothetical protein